MLLRRTDVDLAWFSRSHLTKRGADAIASARLGHRMSNLPNVGSE